MRSNVEIVYVNCLILWKYKHDFCVTQVFEGHIKKFLKKYDIRITLLFLLSISIEVEFCLLHITLVIDGT